MLTVLATALVTGAGQTIMFGQHADIDRARLSEQVRENAEDIGDLTRLLREVAASQANFQSNVAALTARFDTFLDKQGG
jgi:ribose 1,5-bisphosphokinase PhnN